MLSSPARFLLASVLCGLTLLAVEARGQNLLLNGGFETNNLSSSGTSGYLLGDSSVASTAPVASPWVFSVNNGSGLTSAGNTTFVLNGAAADGTAFGIVRRTSTSTGMLSQAVTLNPGTYTLAYSEAGRSSSGTATYTSSVVTIRLTGATAGALTLTPAAGTAATTQTNTVAAGSAFAPVQYSFMVAATDTYTLAFTGTTATPTNASTYLDAISITAVPEPSSWLACGAGLLLLAAVRRRAVRR